MPPASPQGGTPVSRSPDRGRSNLQRGDSAVSSVSPRGDTSLHSSVPSASTGSNLQREEYPGRRRAGHPQNGDIPAQKSTAISLGGFFPFWLGDNGLAGFRTRPEMPEPECCAAAVTAGGGSVSETHSSCCRQRMLSRNPKIRGQITH